MCSYLEDIETPSHDPYFGLDSKDKAHFFSVMNLRELFHMALHIEEQYELLNLFWRHVRNILLSYSDNVKEINFQKLLWHYNQSKKNEIDLLEKRVVAGSRENDLNAIMQYMPESLLDGCWLRHTYSAAISHTSVSALLLKMHSLKLGDGQLSDMWANHFRLSLCRNGIYPSDLTSWQFASNQKLLEDCFAIPVFLQAISFFPRKFLPEIIGVTLFNIGYGLCPLHIVIDKKLNDAQPSSYVNQYSQKMYLTEFIENISNIVKSLSCIESIDFLKRIHCGFVVMYDLYERRRVTILQNYSSPKSGYSEMCQLVTNKARFAFGFHKKVKMGGKILDDWFNPKNFDINAFLSALAESSYVVPGHPENSLLITKLLAFDGPMFKIFNTEEIQIIKNWIVDLKNFRQQKQHVPEQLDLNPKPHISLQIKEKFSSNSQDRYGKKGVREWFYALLHVEFYPEILPFAKNFAEFWLDLSGKNIETGSMAIPHSHYDSLKFTQWVIDRHRKQVDEYVPLKGAPEQTRDELITQTLQYCPVAYIDGAWIQKVNQLPYLQDEIGMLLYHTYIDEIGNGDISHNHPNVYRELINDMSIKLPTFGSIAYCNWTGFNDDAFLVPVFWLAISQYTHCFFPEILGLNLAMELSGIGGGYMKTADALRYYGYKNTFLKLHNTIDNISSGHTAWALDVIDLYMNKIQEYGGSDIVQQSWKRVWRGFRSLLPPKNVLNRFKSFYYQKV